jgi:hypothetical protein
VSCDTADIADRGFPNVIAASQLHRRLAEPSTAGGTMKTRIWSATCAALALATTVAVLAQDPPSSPASQSQSTAAKSITVTGCVQRAQQSPTGTSGRSTPSAMDPKFVLTNAAISTSGTAGTSGTAAPPSTAVASEYKLDSDESKLTAHVGHKVEISGTVEQPSRATQPPAASAANAPTLKVETVKMVAATCP